MRDLLIKAGLGFAAAAYARDAVQRPQQVARLARGVADRNGKPLVNLGAGVKGKSLRASIEHRKQRKQPSRVRCSKTSTCTVRAVSW